MSETFLIYAAADTSRALAVAEALRAMGVETGADRTLLPGERYETTIPPRLARAKSVVVFWSAAALASPIVMDEAASARDAGKLVAVCLDAIDPPPGFAQLTTHDLTGFPLEPRADEIKNLAAALTAPVAVPPPPLETASAPLPIPPPPKWLTDPEQGSRAQRLRLTFSVFFWTAGLAAIVALLDYVWPLGLRGAIDSTARGPAMAGGMFALAFVVIGFGRSVIYWSRLLIGKPTNHYFGAEMVVITLLTVAVSGLVLRASRLDLTEPGPLAAIAAKALAAWFLTFMLVLPPVLLLGRAIRRILGSKVKSV